MLEQVFKSVLLRLAKNQVANRLARRYGLRLGAQRFVAGEDVESAIAVIRSLNDSGMAVTVDSLGEFVREPAEASAAADQCIHTLEALARAGLQASLSLKLTQLGLDINRTLCVNLARRVLETAQSLSMQVTIDMEDSAHCQAILDLFDTLRVDFPRLGTVIQAYLRRSFADVVRLSQADNHLRIVKGAYRESPEVAFPDKADVDNNFLALIQAQLLGAGFCAIATHDPVILAKAKAFIEKHAIERDRYEFQMLYGVSVPLQEQLLTAGYPVRIYVPFGRDWYGYFMRRLAERPANVAFVLRGLRK